MGYRRKTDRSSALRNIHHKHLKRCDRYLHTLRMDSEVVRDGRLMDLVDESWREDKLLEEDIAVPQMALPEQEQENGPTTETLQEQEEKWTDLALSQLHEQPPATNTS